MCDRLGTPLLWWKLKSWVCSTWRWEGLWGWLNSVCKYLKESVKKTEPCCVQWCPLTGGNDTRWNIKHEDIRKHFFTVTDVFSPKKGHRLPTEVVAHPPLEIFKCCVDVVLGSLLKTTVLEYSSNRQCVNQWSCDHCEKLKISIRILLMHMSRISVKCQFNSFLEFW